MNVDHAFRDQITRAVADALRPLDVVLAGWEGGSAAYGAVDAYSDIDLEYLVADDASFEVLYAVAERALETVSPIVARHSPLKGRYYKLKDGGDFLLVDLIFHRVSDPDHSLGVERHGTHVPLFDKDKWLHPRPLDEATLNSRREQRYRELQTWFPMSQVFVRKAILRDQQVEAVSAYWACTLKPLAELLRMRYCPVRWDFGVRYLDRDLSPSDYEAFSDLALINSLAELDSKLSTATAWGIELLRELDAAWTAGAATLNVPPAPRA